MLLLWLVWGSGAAASCWGRGDRLLRVSRLVAVPVFLCPGGAIDGVGKFPDSMCASGAYVFAFNVSFVPAVDGGVEYCAVDVDFSVVKCVNGVGNDHVEYCGVWRWERRMRHRVVGFGHGYHLSFLCCG